MAQTDADAPGLRRRVLVVDDARSDRDRVERWLVDDGRYLVVTAADGDEARAAIAEERPDCIVLDYVLGDESGLDLLVELSPPGDEDRIPVVMLTGAGHAAVATEALRRGAEDCLIKGAASSEVVRHAVGSAIEKASVRRWQSQQESAEAEARLAIQVAERRASYLAEATRRLASATDVETTLDRLARLAVPFTADRVIIDLVDRAGAPTHRTVFDSEPTGEPLPDTPGAGFDHGHPAAQVLRTGQTQVYLARDDGTADAALAAAAASDARPPAAALVVPLLHGGRPIGTMTFVSFDPLRSYDTAERLVAEEIALRGSLAIGNARGLADRHRVAVETASSTRLLRMLAAISTTLSRPLEPEQALRRVVQQAVPALGALAAVSLASSGELPVAAEHEEAPALRSVDHDALRQVRQAARTTARDLNATTERAVTDPDGGTVAVVLAVPLTPGDHTIGVFETVAAGPAGVDDQTRTVTEDAARRVAAYLERIRATHEQGAIDAALQSSEQKLQLALGAAGAGVFEIQSDPLVVDLDDAHAKLWGFPPGAGPVPLDEALANMAPEARDKLRERLLSALDEGSPFELEYRTQGSAGDRWLLSRGQQLAWHSATDGPRLVGVTLDISQRRQLTERIARDSERTRRLQRATAALSGAVDRAAVTAALSDTVVTAAGAVDVAVLLADESTVGAMPADQAVSDVLLSTLRQIRDDVVEDPEAPVGLQRIAGDDRGWFKLLPLRSAGANVGAIALRFEDPPDVDDDFHRFMMSLTRQVAVALARAQLFARERQIAESLQRRLLPQRLPARDDAELAARYLPANTEVQVGGDWYDAIELDDGGFVFAVGDVMGHGVAAASAMGQLRVGLRALATVDPAPGAIIAAADRLATDLLPDRYATVCIGRVSRADDGGHVVRLASAGHPPVLLVEPNGTADWIDLIATVPVGVAGQVGLEDAVDERTLRLRPGATMLLYTDGLVEHPGEGIDAGQERLRTAAGRIFADAGDDLAASCDRLLEAVVDTEHREDDIALLAVRLR